MDTPNIAQYRVLEKLGAGGMGVVYRGHDPRLARDVAIKILSGEIGDHPDRLARFEREARAIAAASHPNILAVYDFGRCESGPYIVMELLEGASLRASLREGPLPERTAVSIASQIAEGVAAAHAKGIVHRDLKPENVFLTTAGRIKILDFGLAAVEEAPANSIAATIDAERLTADGVVLGTPGYLPPEQLRGEPVDHRADIFAVGTILYEMLIGRPAFQGRSVAEVLAAVVTADPLESEQGRAVPASLLPVLRRCLEKRPGQRFQSAADLQFALETAASATGSHAAPGLATSRHAEQPSVAVLPFVNQSSDPENEYFSDGVTEEILNTLSRVDGLRVAARTSSFAFKGREIDLEEVARRLRVGAVLSGSVRKSGDRIRITAQLVDVGTGFQLWADRYDRRLTDIFEVQDEIAEAIAGALALTFGVDSSDAGRQGPTDNIAAYEQYLKGRAAVGYGMELFRALDAFDRAVELDPSFAAAHAGIGETYATLGFMAALPPRESMPKARQAAERALAIDDRLAEAHCALACVEMSFDWNWNASGERFERALQLNPNFIQTYYHLGHVHCGFVRGHLERGIEICRQGLERDPLATYPLHGLIANLLMAGRYEETILRADQGLEHHPSGFHFHRLAALAYFMLDRLDESERRLREALRISGRHPWAVGELSMLLSRRGDSAGARACYDELLARRACFYTQSTILAMAAVWLGERERAFDHLENALDERDAIVYAITTWPTAAPLRDDRRYESILRRLGLPRPTDPGG